MCDDYNTVNCAGVLCSRYATCRHHFGSGSTVDWSTYGSGKADSNGIIEASPVCGPYSKPPYAKYEGAQLFHVDVAKEGVAHGKLEINPWTTLTIENCEKIILKPKGVEFEAELPTEHFDIIEEIIINGNKFVREK